MGLTLEFVLGDPEAIRKAVEECDLDKLDDPTVVKGRADVSMHITPHDLDTLSAEFAAVSGREPIALRPHLEVLFDDTECGALLVDQDWISYAAGVPVEQVRNVTERWTARMSEEYKDPQIVLTDDAVEAVRALVALCARAKAESEPMVHLWNL